MTALFPSVVAISVEENPDPNWRAPYTPESVLKEIYDLINLQTMSYAMFERYGHVGNKSAAFKRACDYAYYEFTKFRELLQRVKPPEGWRDMVEGDL